MANYTYDPGPQLPNYMKKRAEAGAPSGTARAAKETAPRKKTAEWNDTVKDEYAQQAAHCGHDVLLVNPFCTDPTATDCATGACVHFRNGSIVRELPSGRPGTLLIEL